MSHKIARSVVSICFIVLNETSWFESELSRRIFKALNVEKRLVFADSSVTQVDNSWCDLPRDNLAKKNLK
jgi:hypothetical protein